MQGLDEPPDSRCFSSNCFRLHVQSKTSRVVASRSSISSGLASCVRGREIGYDAPDAYQSGTVEIAWATQSARPQASGFRAHCTPPARGGGTGAETSRPARASVRVRIGRGGRLRGTRALRHRGCLLARSDSEKRLDVRCHWLRGVRSRGGAWQGVGPDTGAQPAKSAS